MRGKSLGWLLALAAAATPAGACAMSASQPGAERPCRVLNGEKLPADTGGPAGVCAAIEKAMAAKAPRVRYSAEVEVRSKAALVATVVPEGGAAVKRQLAVMDKNLNAGSIQRFAETLAAEVARAASS
jgi:hypothetical protein